MASMLDRAALVEHSRETIARGSKSFRAASRLFDREIRERVWLLYAWCRACDDLVDGQTLGGEMEEVDDAPARVAHIRDLTARALKGEATGEPSFDALGVVASETGLTGEMAEAVIGGFALDSREWRPRSEEDMLRYCYHVAGAVGVMMAVVMGVDPKDEATLDRACDLGIAFQLSNISRDLLEDDAAGRCYLPVEWLVEADIPPGQHMRPPYRAKTAKLAARMADLAERYEASARVGAAKLPFRSRWAVLSAAGIYVEIARKVRDAGEHAWDSRITTSRAAKLGHVARAFAAAGAGVGDTPRKGLWSRRSLSA